MTEVLDPPVEIPDPAEPVAPGAVAAWSARAGAICIDLLAGAGLLAVVVITGWSAPRHGWLWWLCAVLAGLIVVALALNRVALPALTGWTVGRSLFGIEVVRRDGTRPGAGRLLLRDLAHLADTVPPLGWLWPLWDTRGRTFADILTGTEVRRVEGPYPDRRRAVTIGVAAAAAAAVVVAGVGYLAVYRPERAVDQARTQIASEGPKIVSQVLSYGKGTVEQDFARARDLVTEGYRPQLVTQQEAVRKAGPVDNEYWPTNSAVLSSTADRAEMLLLMHGQRGAADKQRLITATLRVSFERSGANRWQVSNIAVLTQPNTARQAR